MAVALSQTEFERTIEVLSSATATLQLTRFERITYRALLLSVDTALISFFGAILLAIVGLFAEEAPFFYAALALTILFVVSFLVGIIALGLNIPLIFKTFRERKRLDQLGLSSLSTSLWKETRRRQWVSRIRSALLLGIGILIIVGMLLSSMTSEKATLGDRITIFALYAVTAGLLFGARYLRNQREQMDLVASADKLKADLQKRQQQEKPGADAVPAVVSVPADILERTAIIESAQINKERKDAVLQGTSSRENAYAVTFESEAAQQRASLDRAHRFELEDLVADLSTEGADSETQATAIPGAETGQFRRATENKHVEIDYIVDRASRRIQIKAVRPGSQASLDGAGHV